MKGKFLYKYKAVYLSLFLKLGKKATGFDWPQIFLSSAFYPSLSHLANEPVHEASVVEDGDDGA